MQQSIATVENSSASESVFGQSSKSFLARLWSISKSLGLEAASVPFRILERFDSRIAHSINIDRVSARIGVEQRARSDGENEYPPSSEESMSGTQREIIAHFRQLQRRAQRRTMILADKPRQIRERIDLAGMEGTLRDIPPRCENDLLRMLAEWKSGLNSLSNDAMEQSQEIEAEGEAAERRIPAALKFAFLAAVVSGCAFLLSNTSAFALGGESPVADMWTFATLVAAAVLSSAIARAASSPVRRNGSFSSLGKWLRAATGIVFMGLTSIFASHYLLAMAANPDTSLSAVFVALFVERSVPLLPVADWTVFSIVSAAALTAFIVCYRENSPDSSRHRPRQERLLLLKPLRKINAKIDRAQADVTATLKRAKAALGRYSRRIDQSRHLSAELSDYNDALQDACNMLLDRYRANNCEARKTKAPHSFQEYVYFGAEEDAGVASDEDEGPHLDQLQQEIGKLESLAAQIRQELRGMNSRAIKALEGSTIV